MSVNVKHVTLELGGKNPILVFGDADLDAAVEGAIRGMNFTWQGQSCGSTSRVYVQRDAHDAFLDRLASRRRLAQAGLPDDPTTQTGSMVNQQQFDKVQKYLGIGREEGARLVTGGEHLTDGDLANGLFISPAVFADVDHDSRLAREEIFGPVMAVMPFDDYDDGIRARERHAVRSDRERLHRRRRHARTASRTTSRPATSGSTTARATSSACRSAATRTAASAARRTSRSSSPSPRSRTSTSAL